MIQDNDNDIMTMGNDIMSDDNNDNGKCQCKMIDMMWEVNIRL